MKLRSKFNHSFPNRGCFHCVIRSLQGKRYASFPSNCGKCWKFVTTVSHYCGVIIEGL